MRLITIVATLAGASAVLAAPVAKGPTAECFGNGCKWNIPSCLGSTLILNLVVGGGYPWKREAEAAPKGPVAECFGNGCECCLSDKPMSNLI
jgi:hypothetical protein